MDTYFLTCICCYQIRNNRSQAGEAGQAFERNIVRLIFHLNARKPHFLNEFLRVLCTHVRFSVVFCTLNLNLEPRQTQITIDKINT